MHHLIDEKLSKKLFLFEPYYCDVFGKIVFFLIKTILFEPDYCDDFHKIVFFWKNYFCWTRLLCWFSKPKKRFKKKIFYSLPNKLQNQWKSEDFYMKLKVTILFLVLSKTLFTLDTEGKFWHQIRMFAF